MLTKTRSMLGGALRGLKREPFFLITLAATLVVSCFSRPQWSAIHWNVISILLSQMLACAAFEDCRALTFAAQRILGRFNTPRKLSLVLVLFTGILSMFVTNDIALITVVPLTLGISKLTGKDPYLLIILETAAANLFSALTPFGNPQNLYLFSFYAIPTGEFFTAMLPFCLLGLVLLIPVTLLTSGGKPFEAQRQNTSIGNKRLFYVSAFLFVLNILAVLRAVDYRLALAATLIAYLTLAPRLFKRVDYVLLLTFVLFFLFSSGITAIEPVRAFFSSLLGTKTGVLFASAAASQIVSNVPAAVLLSGFTPYYRELLYGVSAGGLGTLIASLASLISYKFYIREFGPKKYMKAFSILNFAFLAVLLGGLTLVIWLW